MACDSFLNLFGTACSETRLSRLSCRRLHEIPSHVKRFTSRIIESQRVQSRRGSRDSQILRALYHHGFNIYILARRNKRKPIPVKEPEFQFRANDFLFLSLSLFKSRVIERTKTFREHKSWASIKRPLRSVQKPRNAYWRRGRASEWNLAEPATITWYSMHDQDVPLFRHYVAAERSKISFNPRLRTWWFCTRSSRIVIPTAFPLSRISRNDYTRFDLRRGCIEFFLFSIYIYILQSSDVFVNARGIRKCSRAERANRYLFHRENWRIIKDARIEIKEKRFAVLKSLIYNSKRPTKI